MRVRSLMALAALAVATAGLAAAEPPQAAREGVPVVVANRQIIVLRGPIAGYTAAERAAAAMQKIESALEAERLPQVTTENTPEGTRVRVGGAHAFLVTTIDIDTQAGETTQLLAKAAAMRLEEAIAAKREEQSTGYRLRAAAYTAAATLLLVVLVWLVFRVDRTIGAYLARSAGRSAEAHASRLNVGGVRLLDAAHVLLIARRAFTVAAWIVALALASAWLTFVLERFHQTRSWGMNMEHRLLDIAKEFGLGIIAALPGLLFVILIFLITRALVRAASVFFAQVESGERVVELVDADTARPTRRIVQFILWIFAVAVAYPYLPGAQTEAFKGLSVLVGLMVSLGATSVVGQAFNGFILMFSRAYRKGDFVRIGDNEGTVESLGTFVTQIRTGLGEELTLPNSMVMASTIRNYSRAAPGTGCVLDTAVTIGYATPWRQVHAMLEAAARRTEHIAGAPAPFVRQTALSDFYVEYRLVAYTPTSDPTLRADVLNKLHGNIQDVFNEHGVQIMSPHYMTDPSALQVVPKEQWYTAPAQPPPGDEAKR